MNLWELIPVTQKAVLIDDRMSIVGSYNMDMRSTYQDTELMLAVDCPELNSIIQTKWNATKHTAKQWEMTENMITVKTITPKI